MKNTLAYCALAVLSFAALTFVIKPFAVRVIDASMHQVTAALAGQR